MTLKFPDLSEVEKEVLRHDSQRWGQRLLDTDTNEEAYRVMDEEKRSLDQVRRAFYEATKDRNSMSACMVTDIGYLRDLVQTWRILKNKGLKDGKAS